MQSTSMQSGGRYPVLRAIGILYMVGAGAVVVATFGSTVWALVAYHTPMVDRIVIAGGILAAGFFITLGLLAIAEVIKLAIDVEHSARATALATTMRLEQSGSCAAPATSVIVGSNSVPVTPPAQNRTSSFHTNDEETAEAALLRGR